MQTKQVPVVLLTGYLGSGKTTLVNHILNNRRGIKFAVIVNDIGEVNIDADLIAKGGVVGAKDDSLVALQNGCICCTLRMDLIEQLNDIMKLDKFDYIVIEASGICEPAPIAQTICSMASMDEKYTRYGVPYIDAIVTVVDARRMRHEFGCGDSLRKKEIGEDDIENLVIQQIEFCNIIILNKVSDVTADELGHIKAVIRALQPAAKIIECDYGNVDLDSILHTHSFDFEAVATSAGWIREIERPVTEDEEIEAQADHHHHHEEHHHHHEEGEDHHCDEHCHHHHHHHDHEGGEVEEYGIQTMVYYRRPAFDLNKFDYFVGRKWPANIIRTKGICYFSNNPDMSMLFEQAGDDKRLTQSGLWYATAPEEDLIKLMQAEPGLMRDWDATYGDRMIKLVFIGRNIDKEALTRDLDDCLAK